MKKRIAIMAAIVVVFAAVIVVITAGLKLSSFASSPKYQGHTVNYWLAEVFTTNQSAAMAALRSAGPEAMPALVNAFSRRDSGWYGFYRRIYPRLPGTWRRDLPRPVSAEELWNATSLVMFNNTNRRAALPDLIRLLRDDENPARLYVLSVAGVCIKPQDTEAIPVLTQCLRSPEARVRSQAAGALQTFCSQAREALPMLNDMMKDSDLSVRVAAARTVWAIDRRTNGVVEILREAVTSPQMNSPASRYFAAASLNQVVPNDPLAIDGMIEALKSSDQSLHLSVIVNLGYCGPAASAAVPFIVAELDKGDPRIRVPVLAALKKIDPEAAAKYEQH